LGKRRGGRPRQRRLSGSHRRRRIYIRGRRPFYDWDKRGRRREKRKGGERIRQSRSKGREKLNRARKQRRVENATLTASRKQTSPGLSRRGGWFDRDRFGDAETQPRARTQRSESALPNVRRGRKSTSSAAKGRRKRERKRPIQKHIQSHAGREKKGEEKGGGGGGFGRTDELTRKKKGRYC